MSRRSRTLKEKRTLELVTIYQDTQVIITSTIGTAETLEDWKAKGERAADFFYSNVPGAWIDGFYARLEELYETKLFPADARRWVRPDEPSSFAQYRDISKRKVMLD